MYIISLLQGMVFYAPIATLYRTTQGLSVFQITLTESLFFILCLLMEIPWGIMADSIGYKKTMIFCCGLYFVSKIVFWQAAGFGWFLIERIKPSRASQHDEIGQIGNQGCNQLCHGAELFFLQAFIRCMIIDRMESRNDCMFCRKVLNHLETRQ